MFVTICFAYLGVQTFVTPMRRLLKMIGLVSMSIGLFYVLNRLSVDLLKWQMTLPLIKQLFSCFALGSILWLTGRAVNYMLLYCSCRMQISATMTITLLAVCWLTNSWFIVSSLKPALTEASWSAIAMSLILTAEVTLYPLIACFYQRKEVLSGHSSSCALNSPLVNVQTIR